MAPRYAVSVSAPAFDKLYNYSDLAAAVDSLVSEFPGLCEVSSIGLSYEGREIRLLTITDQTTGPAEEKPAFWLDANIHATELTGTTAALHYAWTLLSRAAAGEPRETAIVRGCTAYIVPRLNPDGAEHVLTVGTYLRSSVRPYQRLDHQRGLREYDVDGDGRILSMRIADPNGSWRVDADEPRLLCPRAPDDLGLDGPYYRVVMEGTIDDFDGVTFSNATPEKGLDLNRNYPTWRPENEQVGAGPHPLSEPEVDAVVRAMTSRQNICLFNTYHTYGGLHLRPYASKADDEMPTGDLRLYKYLGECMTKITGYPCISVFHDFKYHPKQVESGASDDWAYEHLGIPGWTTEIWSLKREAGLTDTRYIEWFDWHDPADDRALLKYSDEALHAKGYVDWYPFEHPQLGRVELGGWDTLRSWSNPPDHLLETEIVPLTDVALFNLSLLPRLEHHSTQVRRLDGDAWAVRVVVQNTGFMSANVTEKAVERKIPGLEISLPDDIVIVNGDRVQKLGHPGGRADARSSTLAADDTGDRAKGEWVVQAAQGASFVATAVHPRAGTVRIPVTLA